MTHGTPAISNPLVSVVIPAYNQAAFLGEAIRSVLNQTYTNLELIVVDDCSPDNTGGVVYSFSDSRLHYIRHESNQMLAATRNTGMRAAHGEIFALLDADDYFAPNKLAMHVQHLQQNPQIAISYSGCGLLRCSDQQLRNLGRVPVRVGLSNLVLGFPFSPSDMVVRATAAFAVGLFDASYTCFSEDLDFNCRLALEGWQFGGIDRCLTYRRFHPGRVIANPRERLTAALRSLAQTLSAPQTPPAVLALEDRAYANHLIVWGVEALRGGDTATGREFLKEALRRQPGIVEGWPNELTRFLVYEAAHDDTLDLRQVYCGVIEQLTDEFDVAKQQATWGIGRAWLVSAYRAGIWGQAADARRCLAEAAQLHARCDEDYVSEVVHQLLGWELERGRAVADAAAAGLNDLFCSVFGRSSTPDFCGALEVGRTIEYYNTGRYEDVPAQVWRAIRSSPHRAFNRNSLSILLGAVRQGGRHSSRSGGSAPSTRRNEE